MVFKISMNISQYIRYAVLLQEATIARHPNKQMQTQKDLKKKKKKSQFLSHCNSGYRIKVSEYV